MRDLWINRAVPYCVELATLTAEQVIRKKICHKHFEAKFLIGNKRSKNACPTLFTADEMNTGIPNLPVNLIIPYCKVDMDHTYAQPVTYTDTPTKTPIENVLSEIYQPSTSQHSEDMVNQIPNSPVTLSQSFQSEEKNEVDCSNIKRKLIDSEDVQHRKLLKSSDEKHDISENISTSPDPAMKPQYTQLHSAPAKRPRLIPKIKDLTPRCRKII
ncbi:hypothetical protein ACJJTC_001876 [Scirpophaga incertulas]